MKMFLGQIMIAAVGGVVAYYLINRLEQRGSIL